MNVKDLKKPLAIAMWDFSWLERRWPGAGYEDWDSSLDELLERGYNAVRIDAYPHLLALDPHKEWEILPCWNQQNWGSPARNKISIQPALNQFIEKCKERDILVALSSWFQRDEGESWKLIFSAEKHAEIWIKTLDSIAEQGLLDSILYVDFCNEWPLGIWAPFFNREETKSWNDPSSLKWMETAVNKVKSKYPDLSYTFSHIGNINLKDGQSGKIGFIDFLEPHIWMAQANDDEFYKLIDYNYERFETKGFENLVRSAQKLYEADPAYWNRLQEEFIDSVVEESIHYNLPLITTESWSVVDFKDWPLLDWEWVKRSCSNGIAYAAQKGRWLAMATSNFCGPQFVGMWRDVAWHKEMTAIIKSSVLPF